MRIRFESSKRHSDSLAEAAPEIDVDTLRESLDRGLPMFILDVRPAAERAEWSIPGSVHVDAYQALRAGNSQALAHVAPPPDLPVVAVCAAGRTSQMAVAQLRMRGIAATSLRGGMKAWSAAWNTAELVTGEFTLLQVRRTGKGCLSYLVASGKEAVVVDASLDARVYLDLARSRGWAIRHVLDTHIHADHLSRSRQLAVATGATHWLPEQKRVRFQHEIMRDNDRLKVGGLTIHAMHTPGHTMESTCYQVGETWLLTGDTLFPASVGRPDLEASPEEVRVRARLLHASLRRLFALDAGLLILPCHTDRPVPFDRQVVGTSLGKAREAIRLPSTAQEFADRIMQRIPPTPPNHRTIVKLNEVGSLPNSDPTDLEAGANRCAIS